jgi:hypothetical protein
MEDDNEDWRDMLAADAKCRDVHDIVYNLKTVILESDDKFLQEYKYSAAMYRLLQTNLFGRPLSTTSPPAAITPVRRDAATLVDDMELNINFLTAVVGTQHWCGHEYAYQCVSTLYSLLAFDNHSNNMFDGEYSTIIMMHAFRYSLRYFCWCRMQRDMDGPVGKSVAFLYVTSALRAITELRQHIHR